MKRRGAVQKLVDFLTFPLRAVTLFEQDRWGLSALATERFDYAAREVTGFCLDVGCGRHNRFVTEHLDGRGRGIDVYPYEGLSDEHLVADMTRLPFPDATFDSVALIACINHIPRAARDAELAEMHRCLKPGGNIIVTMGAPFAEVLVHKTVWLHDKLFGTRHDMDSERGMKAEEEYYLTDAEIRERLARAGFRRLRKKRFLTQWGLNHLFVGWKDAGGPAQPPANHERRGI
jgi:SAM-dependent methyltransferase